MKKCTGSSCCTAASCGSSTACTCSRSRQSRSGLWLLFGLAGGFLGGMALARRMKEQRGPKGLAVWRRELAKTRGEVDASFLAARIHAEYEKLYAARPRFDHPALVKHLEGNILPGLALYSVLTAAMPEPEAALAEFDRLLEASALAGPMALQGRLLKLFPDPFAIFRMVHNAMLPRQFPREGWDFHWVEDSDSAIAYDCRDCFYLRVLTAYGVPDLTAHFCKIDDVMFSRFPYFAWKRTKTLGRGDDCCDFRYERN